MSSNLQHARGSNIDANVDNSNIVNDGPSNNIPIDLTPESLRRHDQILHEDVERGAGAKSTSFKPFEAEPTSRYVNMDNMNAENVSVVALSIASTTMTVDGISDWLGFCTVCYIVLLGDMSRGIMFPTLWPLVRSLGGTEVTQGYAVAAFSFGRILVSPLFGSWSVSYGYKYTLLFSSSILLFGTLLYSQVPYVGRSEFLILAQTTLGIGSGTLGVTRAYVAEISPTRNRTTYMAYLTALQYAGFTVTPFLGSLFSAIFKDVDEQGFETG